MRHAGYHCPEHELVLVTNMIYFSNTLTKCCFGSHVSSEFNPEFDLVALAGCYACVELFGWRDLQAWRGCARASSWTGPGSA